MNNVTMLSPRRRGRRRRKVPNYHLSSFLPSCYLQEKVIPTRGFMFFFIRSGHLFLLLTILQQQSTSALLAELPTEPSSSSSSSLSTATKKTDYRDQLPRNISQSHSPDNLSPSFDVKRNPMPTRNKKKLSSFDHTSIEISKVLTLRTHSLTEDSSRILSTTQTQNSIGLHPRISNAGCFGTHCGLDTSSSYPSLGTVVPIHVRPSSSRLTPASSSREIISGSPFLGPTSVVKSISAGSILMAHPTTAITASPQPRHKKKRHKKRKKKRRKKKKRKKKKSRRKGRRTTVEWEVEELRKTTPRAKTQKNGRMKWVAKQDRNLNIQIPSPVEISESVNLKSERFLAPYQKHESSSLFSSRMTSQPISLSEVTEKTFQTIKSTPVFKGSSISLKETVTFPDLIHSRSLRDSWVLSNHLRIDFTQTNFAQPLIATKTKNYFNELNEIHSSLTKNQIPIPNSNLQEFINIHSSVTTPYFISKSSESKPLSKESKTFPSSFKFHSIYKPSYDEMQSSAQLLLNSYFSLKNFQNEDNIPHSVHASKFSDMEPPKSQSLSQTKFPVHPTLSEQSSFLTTSETASMSLTNIENSSKFMSLENMIQKFSEITGKPFDAIKPTKYSFSAKETMTFTDLIPSTSLQNRLIPSRHSRTSLIPSAQTNYDNELNKVNPSLANNKIPAQITHSNTQKQVNIRKRSTTPYYTETSSSETNVFTDSNILSSSFSFHSTDKTGFSQLQSPLLLRNTQLENIFSSLELPHKNNMSSMVYPTMSSNLEAPESLIASQMKISMHTNISEQTYVQTSTLNKTAHIVSKNTVNSTKYTSPRSIIAFHTIFPLIIGKKSEMTKKTFPPIKASSISRASFPVKKTLMVFNLVPSRSLHDHLVTSHQLNANLVPSAITNYDNKLKKVNLSSSKSQIPTQISPSNTQIPLNTHSYSTTPYYFTKSSESKFVSKDVNILSPSSNFNSLMADFSKLKSPLLLLSSQHKNIFSSLQDFLPEHSSFNSIQPTKSSDMESLQSLILSQMKISTLTNISEQNPVQSSTSNVTAHMISKNAVNSKKYTSLKSILVFQARQIPVIKKSSEVIQNSLKTRKVMPIIRTSLISVRETMTFLNFAASKLLLDHLITSHLKSSTLTPSVQTYYDNEHNRVHPLLNKNQIPSADSNSPKLINSRSSVTNPYIMAESSESEPLSKDLNILSSNFNFHDEVQSSSQLLISTQLENTFPSLQNIQHEVSIFNSIYPTISSYTESTQSQSLSQMKILIHPTPSEQKSSFTLTSNNTHYISPISIMNYTKSLGNVRAFRRNPPIIENSFEISKLVLPMSSSTVDNPGLPQIYISHSMLKAEHSQNVFSTVTDQLITKAQPVSSTLTPLSVSDVSENLNMMDVLTFIDTMLQLKAEDSAIAELPSLRSSSIPLQSLYSPASPLVSHSQTNAQHERTKKSADEEKPLSLRKISLKDNHFEYSREIVLESSSVNEPVYESFSTDFVSSSMPSSKTPPTNELKEDKSSTFADSLDSVITSSQEHFTDVLSNTSQPQSITSLNDFHPLQTPSSPPATFDTNPPPTPLPAGFSLNHTVDQRISQTFNAVEDEQNSSIVLSPQKKDSQKDSSDISPLTTEVTFSRTTNDLTSSDSMLLFLEQEGKRISTFMPSNSKKNIFSEGLSPLSAAIMSDQVTSDNSIDISSSFPEISSFDSTSRTSVLPIAPNMASFAIPLDYPMLSVISSANKLHFSASESHSKSLNTVLIPEGGLTMASSTGDTTDELFSAPNLFSDSVDVKPDSWDASTDSTSANSGEAFVTESDIQSTMLITRDVSITAEQITSSKYEDGDSLLNSKLLISPVQLTEYQELSRKKTIIASSFASADLNSQDELVGSTWKIFDLNTSEDDLFLTSHLKFSLVSPFESVSVDSSTVQLTPHMRSSSSVLEISSTSSIWTLSSPPFLKEPEDNIKATEDDLALSGSVNKASSNPFDYASSVDLASENRDFLLPGQFLEPSYSSVGISSSIFQPLSDLNNERLSISQTEKSLLFMAEQSLLLYEFSSSYSSLKFSKVSSSSSSASSSSLSSSQLPMVLPVSSEESSHIESSRLATHLSSLSSPLDLSEQISPPSTWLDELSISSHLFSWPEDSHFTSSMMAEPSMSILSGFTDEVDQPEWTSQVEGSSQLLESFYQVQSIYLADSNLVQRQLDLPFVSQLSPLVDTLQQKSSQLSSALSVPVITKKLSSQIMSTQLSYTTSQMTTNLSSSSLQTTSKIRTNFPSQSSQTTSQLTTNLSSSSLQTTSQIRTNFPSQSSQTTSQMTTNLSSSSLQTTSKIRTNFPSQSSQTTSQMTTNLSSSSLQTTSQIRTNFPSQSSQTTSQMTTNLSSSSLQTTSQIRTNFPSQSSQTTSQMTTNLSSSSLQTTSKIRTNFPSQSSQTTSQMTTNTLSQLTSQLPSLFTPFTSVMHTPSTSKKFASQITTKLTSLPSSRITSKMATFLTPSSLTELITSKISTQLGPSPSTNITSHIFAIHISSPSSQITSPMLTLFTPYQSSKITYHMLTLLRSSPSSQIESDMSTLFRPSPYLQIESDMSTLLRPSPSSQISSDMSTLLRPSPSSQISSYMSTLLRPSPSSQISSDMSTLLRPSQSSQITSDMSTLLRLSRSSEISSDMLTLLKSFPSSQITSDMSTLLRPSQSSQITYDMSTLLRLSRSSDISSDMLTSFKSSPSSQISSDMSTLLRPSPPSEISFYMSTLIIPSPSLQITSVMSTLLRPSPSSQISSDISTLLRPFQSSQITNNMSILLRLSPSSQISSDMSKLCRSSEYSQISFDMSTLLRPLPSLQISSDISTLLRPFQSSQISSDMSTLLRPSPSSQISSDMSTLLRPLPSLQILSDTSTLRRPSPSSQVTSDMSTLLRPSPSSQISSDMSTSLRASPSSQISSDMSTLFGPSLSSQISSDMSTLLRPSPSSQISSDMSALLRPSPFSQITSHMPKLITPDSSSNIASDMSTLLIPSPTAKITSHMYTFVTSSPPSQIMSHMSTLFIPSSSSQITSHVTMQDIFSSPLEGTFQMSSQFPPQYTTEISKSSGFMSLFVANKSIKLETLQFTSPRLSSQTQFPHQTLLFSSKLRQSLTLKSKFNSMQSISNSSQIHSLFPLSQKSDLSHQTSQFSSVPDSSHSSSSSIQLKSSGSEPFPSSELDMTHSTKFSSSYPTSDLMSQPMLPSSPTQMFSSFSLTLHSIPKKLNSSSFQSESFKTEIISMSNFDSNLIRTFSVTKTLNRLFNSTSLFHSTTKLATFSDIDKSSHLTTPLDITLPTTLEPLLNLSQAFQNYWVITVIKVRLSINVSTAAFRKEMERNLAQAYVEAYHRGEHILNGTYQPLRKKRFALVDDVALQMINITRSPSNSSNNVSMVYYMEKRGKPVPAISATRHLSLLQPQELAIYLKQVVVLSAITYLKPPHPEPSKDWIIGAVLGTLSSALFLIWCILFIYFKCFRMRPTKSVHNKSPTPQLVHTTSMQDVNTDTSETNLIRQDIPIRKQPSLLKKNGSKKQAYSVVLPKVGKKNKKESESEVSLKNLYEEKKKMKKAVNGRTIKKSEGKTDVKIKMDAVDQKQNGCLVVGEHNGYSKEPDNYSDYEIESGNRVEMLPPLSINCGTSNERLSPFHYVNLPTIQPHFSLTASRQEADDELRHQADHLRRIKKQRLKEERRKLRHVELYQNSPHYFLNHGQDIEVVENRQRIETADESQFEELRRGSRRRRYKRREKHDLSSQEDSSLNDVYGGDETWAPQPETLQRTREKMHKLLDDAFQLIAKHERKKVSASIHPLSNGCTRKSSIGKRRTRRQRTCVLETPPDFCHRKSSPSDSTPDEKLERLHTPLFFHNHYSPHNRHRVSSAIPPPWNAAGDEAAKIAAEHQAWSSPYVSPRLNRSDPTDERRIPTISYPTDHNQMEFGYPPSFSFTRPTLSTQFSPYTSSRQMFHNRHSGYHSVDNSEDVATNLFQSATHCFAPQIENNIELNTFEPPSFAKHLSRSPGSSKTSPMDDEIDVIHNNVRPDPSSQPLIQSIREELMRLSNEKQEKNSLRSRIVLDRNI